ncbi:hypothetical protein B0E53_06769 [Micromonospora sp. MH33]|nr:hypothetical protein B0E53_06769 [Micromonospora sp. MH33]
MVPGVPVPGWPPVPPPVVPPPTVPLPGAVWCTPEVVAVPFAAGPKLPTPGPADGVLTDGPLRSVGSVGSPWPGRPESGGSGTTIRPYAEKS